MVGRSKIWQLSHFLDDTRKIVKCSLCPVQIKFVGNTTNMARHLEIKHPLEFAALSPQNHSTVSVNALARHRHIQKEMIQNKEESAICRILEQHRQELIKQHGGSPVGSPPEVAPPPAPSPGAIINHSILEPDSRVTDWSWHVPVKGVSSIEDRMSAAGEVGVGEELQAAVSPESVLGPAAAEVQDRDPTPPPTTPLPPPKPESYQLRHNNHLTIVLEALAQDESFMDVTLTAQGRSLKAHKSVLSAVSPYFRGVLRENPCQHPIIIMPRDVRYEELYSIVNYIYKGEMTVAADDLTSLLKTAELLQVSGLAPSNSPTTSVNPNLGNPHVPTRQRSGSNSSFGSVKPRAMVVLPNTNRTSNYPSVNPTDFMDVDMTYVKEEVASDDEDNSSNVRNSATSSSVTNTSATTTAQESETKERSRHNSTDSTPSTDNLKTNSPQTFPQANSPNSNGSTLKPDPDENPSQASNSNSNLSINSNSNSDNISEEQSAPEPFSCPHCKECHRGCEVMATHLRLKHPTKPSFLCLCGRVFLRQSLKQAHAKNCSAATDN